MSEGLPDLTLIAGPIGNLADLSPRAAQALRDADFWIVEDTRVSSKLAAHLEIRKPMVVLNDHTPKSKLNSYVQRMVGGEKGILLSDAGTPGISDPGAEIVDACLESELTVDAIPGPSAVTDALMLSGFFAQRFSFLGFLSKKVSQARKELDPLADSPMTVVLFESPFRIEATLRTAWEALGSRRYAICRELTKRHQQVVRGTLPNVPTEQEMPRKGEITLVIEGKRRKHDFKD